MILNVELTNIIVIYQDISRRETIQNLLRAEKIHIHHNADKETLSCIQKARVAIVRMTDEEFDSQVFELAT